MRVFFSATVQYLVAIRKVIDAKRIDQRRQFLVLQIAGERLGNSISRQQHQAADETKPPCFGSAPRWQK